MIERLFVYGTLTPGRPNEHVLANVTGHWQTASVRGQLYEMGWGAEQGYPGIILDEGGPKVRGFLFTSDELSNHWSRLDDFEGDGYVRVRAMATVGSGQIVQAHIYSLAPR